MPAYHVGGGADLLAAVQEQRLEGIVAKRTDSRYLPGKRNPAWIKVKVRPRQELVVGGWQPGEDGRAGHLGSLLVAYYEGLGAAELNCLCGLLPGLASDECPFDLPPPRPVDPPRSVRPELVAEVTFAELTSSGTLRHPSYIATREDKDSHDVVREGWTPPARDASARGSA